MFIPLNEPPRFILLAYTAGMMALTVALMAFAYNAGWSRTRLFPNKIHFHWLTALVYLVFSFIGYFLCQVFLLISIWYQILFLDSFIFTIFVIEDFFIITWLVWMLVYHIFEPPLSPDRKHSGRVNLDNPTNEDYG